MMRVKLAGEILIIPIQYAVILSTCNQCYSNTIAVSHKFHSIVKLVDWRNELTCCFFVVYSNIRAICLKLVPVWQDSNKTMKTEYTVHVYTIFIVQRERSADLL